ncbi:hypothetical protein Taro_020457 [Colocasia esculenta]|uniref:Uncharacterized protein n=1 Tax=Colocasia esculenta TaxID=4460 RepID=A0A843V2E2_COLES|nr:hypothetical protein [Colocasia esculenta]
MIRPKICNFCKGSVDTRSSSVDTMLQIQVSTLDQVVSTQCFKYKAKRSSSVDTRSSSVDTRDSFQKTFWPMWDSVSTLDQCVDTRSGSVDTRELPRTPSELFWDSVSTLDQVVSTLVALPEKKMSQVVSTQCFKYKAKRSSSVNTRSSRVDTRDSFQKTFWPMWDSVLTLDQVVSTLDQLPETFWVKLG